MDNRFLFRGKIASNGDWTEGTGIFEDGKNTWLVRNKLNTAIAFGMQKEIVDPATIGQCTGLKDKNGKQGYEHDITKDKNGNIYVIEWHAENGEMCLVYHFEGGYTITPIRHIATHEVIGNIHDDPELLGGEAK